jgi:hypothetical protein
MHDDSDTIIVDSDDSDSCNQMNEGPSVQEATITDKQDDDGSRNSRNSSDESIVESRRRVMSKRRVIVDSDEDSRQNFC